MHGNWVIELAHRDWADLSEDERAVFADWLRTSSGRDLFLLVRYALRYRKQSSASNLKAAERPDDG